jgi:hypothetical protein
MVDPAPAKFEAGSVVDLGAVQSDKQRTAKKAGRLSWRALTRAIHRDTGHIAVGLTLVYAISGIAVNHIYDWGEQSFESYERQIELGGAIAGSDDEAAAAVLSRLGVKAPVRDVYRATPEELTVTLDKRTLHVNTATGHVIDEGQKPRFFLRVANWLHLNRGKKAWTLIADLYAAGLILLALSGILMTPGRKGILGRGGILVLAGAAVPVVYVELSGGPEQQSDRSRVEAPAENPGKAKERLQ